MALRLQELEEELDKRFADLEALDPDDLEQTEKELSEQFAPFTFKLRIHCTYNSNRRPRLQCEGELEIDTER